jgi:hypothetical protein
MSCLRRALLVASAALLLTSATASPAGADRGDDRQKRIHLLGDIVGSNNGMAPWTGNTAPTPEQTAEVLGRTAASIEGIHDAFAAARSQRSRAVMIMTQADMFDPP